MNDLRKKLANGYIKSEQGLLNRLYELERTLKDIELDNSESSKNLRQRIKSEINVIRYDIDTMQGIIEEKYIDIEKLREKNIKFENEINSIYEHEKVNINLIDLQNTFDRIITVGWIIGATGIYLTDNSLYEQIFSYVFTIFMLLFCIRLCYIIYYLAKYRNLVKTLFKLRKENNQFKKQIEAKVKEVEALRRDLYFINKSSGSKNKTTGNHNENREWLEKHFNGLINGSLKIESLADTNNLEEIKELKGIQGSENLLAKQLAIIYKQEFGYSISPEQIKGMIIYKNR